MGAFVPTPIDLPWPRARPSLLLLLVPDCDPVWLVLEEPVRFAEA